MSVCLDIGTTEFRCLRRSPTCLIGRKSPAVYLSLPNEAEDQNLLKQMKIPTIRCDDSLVVVGTAARDLAKSMRIPTIPLLIDGLVPANDPLGRQLISLVVDSILPANGDGESCGLIARGAVDLQQMIDLRLLTQLLTLKGYVPVPVSSSSALASAELGYDQYTGIVLDWGASGASWGVYRLGETLLETHQAQGGHGIDERFATLRGRCCWDREGNRYLDTQPIVAWKQSSGIHLDQPRTDDEKLLADLYREQLLSIVLRFKTALVASSAAWLFSHPMKLICSGGSTRVGGFLPLLAALIREVELPISVSEIQVCTPDIFRLTRGAMIQLEVDRLASPGVHAA